MVGGESVSWDLVVGQQEAVRRLEAAVTAPVHAYLFVGPGGAGKRRAATVFAGELLAAADPDNAERHRRLAVDESHADVHMLDPVGNNCAATKKRNRSLCRPVGRRSKASARS